MTKLFNIRPRWRNLFLARALLFAISIVLSSSGADVEHFDATDGNHFAASRRLGQSDGAAETLLEQEVNRELQSSKSSKSAKAKSSKIGSKSGGSKGSKSKGSKSKSGKSKAGKWSKSKSSKIGSKSGSKGSKGSKSKSSEKGKSAKSIYSEESEESFQTKSLNDIEPMLIDTETENMQLPQASPVTESVYNDSVDDGDGDPADALSASNIVSTTSSQEETEEYNSVEGSSSDGIIERDDGDVISAEIKGDPETSNLQGDVEVEKNEGDHLDIADAQIVDSNNSISHVDASQEDIEGSDNASTEEDTASSYNTAVEHNIETDDGDVISSETEGDPETTNLEGDAEVEKNEEVNLDIYGGTGDQMVGSSSVSHVDMSQEDIEDTDNASTEEDTTSSNDTAVEQNIEHEIIAETANLEAELVDEKIEESEAVVNLDEDDEAVLDIYRESVE